MPSQQQVHDDIQFWLGNQDREHNLFLSLGLEDPNLRLEAARLYDAYEKAKASGSDEALLHLVAPSQDLKRRAYELSDGGKWIGWLFPLFYDHTRREIDYAMARIQRDLSDEEECAFWTLIGAEHAAMAAQLLDPREHAAVLKGFQISEDFQNLHEGCKQTVMPSFIELSRRAGEELDAYAKASGNLKSVIHPALGAHIIREGQRFLQLLDTATVPAAPSNGAMQAQTMSPAAPAVGFIRSW